MRLIFEGNLKVYLEGKNALLPIELNENLFTSSIGSNSTNLIIHDQRRTSIQRIKQIVLDNKQNNFAKVFNKPALAKIFYNDENESLEIYLEDASSPVEFPILWMGVLIDHTMTAYQVDWEILKPLSNESTAFAALIP